MEAVNFEVPMNIIKLAAIGVDVAVLLLVVGLLVSHFRSERGE